MRRTPTAMHPQTGCVELLWFPAGTGNHWLAPNLPPPHSGTFCGPGEQLTMPVAPRQCRHRQSSSGCAPPPTSDFGAKVTESSLQTTAGISSDTTQSEKLTQSSKEQQPPVPCHFWGHRANAHPPACVHGDVCANLCVGGAGDTPEPFTGLMASSCKQHPWVTLFVPPAAGVAATRS